MFVENIKAQLCKATNSQFSDDITKYLIFLWDNLRLIPIADDDNKTHNGLLTCFFDTLATSNVQQFKEQIQQWHVEYLEAKLPDLSLRGYLG